MHRGEGGEHVHAEKHSPRKPTHTVWTAGVNTDEQNSLIGSSLLKANRAARGVGG